MIDLLVTTLPVRSGWSSEEKQNSIFDDPRRRIVSRPHPWRPPTDVYETEAAIIVRVEVAGMRDTDFSLSLSDRSLLIRGTRQDSNERRAYYQMEIPYGDFSTEIELPAPIAIDQAEAVYRDGFLFVILPRALPKQIKVTG